MRWLWRLHCRYARWRGLDPTYALGDYAAALLVLVLVLVEFGLTVGWLDQTLPHVIGEYPEEALTGP